MKKWIVLFALLVPSAASAKYASFICTFSNGQSVEVIARDGNVAVDFDKKGDCQKAFGKVDGDMLIITEIVAGGRFILVWNTNTHEAYSITDHNRTGKRVENHAFCYWS